MNSERRKKPSILTCPTCSTPFSIEATDSMPFCSVRCKQIDLGKWFDETFGLPIEPEVDHDDDFFSSN
ncbi:MAG: DNA gyrase inhibitor YacG [Planctomycetales bacterium]|nr:DNA gyrase inhibitor YacG [Planctomycetales bacterium]